MPAMPNNIIDGILALVRPYRPSLDADALRALLAAPNPNGLVSCSEAAEALGVSVRTIQRRVAEARLIPVTTSTGRYGNLISRYRLSDLRRLCGATSPAASVGADASEAGTTHNTIKD